VSWSGVTLADHESDLVALAQRLGAAHLSTLSDAEPELVDRARAAIAAHGLWGLDVPETEEGAGAGYRTAQVGLATLAQHSPAMALAAAHLAAAAVALAGSGRGSQVLRDALRTGASVAVVEAGRAWSQTPAGTPVVISRVDVCSRDPSLVVIFTDERIGLVEPAAAEFGPVAERTGLDGALSRPARFSVDSVIELPGSRITAVRTRWYAAVAAVAAGLATSAAASAFEYAGQRVQFGGPLTALPVVRERLFDQFADSRTCLLATLTEPGGMAAAAALADRAVGIALATTAAAQQAHGGYGYLDEFAVVRKFRDAVSLQAAADRQRVRAAGIDALLASLPPTGSH
jgi:alkylation response protein AidB-like acyl-CoA dehydrogenase